MSDTTHEPDYMPAVLRDPDPVEAERDLLRAVLGYVLGETLTRDSFLKEQLQRLVPPHVAELRQARSLASIERAGLSQAIKDRDIALWLHAEVQHQLEELTAAKIDDGQLFLGVDIVERVVQASLNDAHGWGRDLENARARLRHVASICLAAASQHQALSRDSLIRALDDIWCEVEPHHEDGERTDAEGSSDA